MKVFVAVVCLLALGTGSTKEIPQFEVSVDEFIASNIRFMERQNRITANVNEYIDKILLSASKFIIMKGFDPLQVDDIIEGFNVKIGFVNFHGELELTHGWLQGLSGLYRSGDATLEYEGNILNLRLPVSFNTMNMNYDYSASIMNLGPYGGLEGKIMGVSAYVDISIDTVTTEIILQEFQITDAGSVNIHFSGNPIVDWLVNVLSKLVTKLLHGVVIDIVEDKVRGLLQTNSEIELYFDEKDKKLEESLLEWQSKYDIDLEAGRNEIQILEAQTEEQEKEYMKVKEEYEKMKKVIDDGKVNRERKRKEEERLEMLRKNATKIQAWWRGMMVRHKLGPYNPKKGKKGKGKDKKAGKKKK
ncbi:uncharacterized protein CBL_06129 [Carabus blaptoides fortunei]